MRIVVLEELTGDVALREQSAGVRNERLMNAERGSDDWRIARVNPADAKALDVALDLKASLPDVHVSLLHLGPAPAAHWMRGELARGCDEAIRVWDGEVAGGGTQAKALVLAAAVRSRRFDLVLTGVANAASAGGQLSVLLGRHLGVPCVTQASIVAPSPGEDSAAAKGERLRVTRDLDRGYRERVEVMLPAVVGVAAGAETRDHVASLPALIAAQTAEVPAWDLATLGVSTEALRTAGAPLRPGQMREPRPARLHLAPPDSSAPAFERILQIVAGTVRRREGRVVRGDDDEVVEALFEALRSDGWLDHLGGERSAGPSAPQ